MWLKYPGIADDIRKRIEKGEFETGKKFPTINEFCGEYKTSSTTIQRAIRVLKGEGLVLSVPALGTYLSNGKPILSKRMRAYEIEQTLRDRLLSGVYGNEFPSTLELMSEFKASNDIISGVAHNLERSKLIYRPNKYGKIYTSEEGMIEYWAGIIIELNVTTRGELSRRDPALYRRLLRYDHLLYKILPVE